MECPLGICIMIRENILLIGPRSGKNVKGGVTYLHDDLRSEIDRRKFDFSEINSNFKDIKALKFCTQLLRGMIGIRRFRVIILDCTFRQLIFFGPLITLFTSSKQVIIIRKWAGSFLYDFESSSFLIKKLIHYTLSRSDLNCFETKEIVAKASELFGRTFWFPNVRHMSMFQSPETVGDSLKAIFVGRIIEEKGVLLACEAVSKLRNVELSIYGKLEEGITAEQLNTFQNVKFHGEIDNSQIQKVMSKNNVLLLPTYFHGEGYPGVILEAFSVSLPVVTTNHNYLPELIEDAGYLVPTHCSDSIKEKLGLVRENYSILREKCKRRFMEFDSKKVHNSFFLELNQLLD